MSLLASDGEQQYLLRILPILIRHTANTLIRDLWPAWLPRLTRDVVGPVAEGTGLVPATSDALDAWCYVYWDREANSDPSRCSCLVYAMPCTMDTVREVIVRLQGFVNVVDIRTLGNWRK